jgi:hypothetical protein
MQIQGAIPQSLDFFGTIPAINKYIKSRTETQVYPETGNSGYDQNNSIIRFKTLEGLIDLKNAYWEFNATTSATGGTYTCFSRGISCIMDRLRVLLGTTVCDNILNANVLYASKLLSEDPNYLSTTAALLMGYTAQAQRITDSTNPNRLYAISLGYISEFLEKVIPSDLIKQPLTIEIYLASANRCLETDTGTNLNYTINNNKFHYSVLEATQDFYGMIQYPILIPYKSWENNTGVFLSGINSSNYTIPFSKKQEVGIYYLSRNQSDVNNPQSLEKFNTYQLYTQYSDSKLKVNNVYFPNDKVDGVNDAYVHMLDFWRKGLEDPCQYGTSWGTTFIIAQNICQRTSDKDNGGGDYLCGVDISKSNSSVVAEINFLSPVPANQEVQYYGNYYNVLTIDAMGRIISFD